MLNKINRLQKDKLFRKIFSKSRPVTVGHLVLRTATNNIGTTRFGFVISNKIDKRATRRNALKRRLRAISRNSISQIKGGYDIVILVRENFPRPYSSHEIEKEVFLGLKRLELLNDAKSSNKTN